jgi:hypothetical protein
MLNELAVIDAPENVGRIMKFRRIHLLCAVAVLFCFVSAAVLFTDNHAYRIASFQTGPCRYWIINSCSGLLFFSVQTGVRRDPDFRSAAFDFTGGYYDEGNGGGWEVTSVAIPYWLILAGPWAIYAAVQR